MFYLRPSRKRAQLGALAGEEKDWAAEFTARAATTNNPSLKSYYRAGIVAADTPLADVPLVALDFETTGLDPLRHDIISIGLVPMTLARIRCAGSRQWLLRPLGDLTSNTVVIHGITHTEIAKAPDLGEVMEELLLQLAGRVVVVHYQSIERQFLDAALRQRIGEGISFPVIDTLELEARLHRRTPLSFWDRLRGRAPVSIRLADSRARYHLPHYRPHHALTDALATAELLQAQVADRFSPETLVSELWI